MPAREIRLPGQSFMILRLRAKSLNGIVAALILVSSAAGIWGAVTLNVPSFTEDAGQPTTLAQFLPIVTGSLVAFSCRSAMSDFEDAAPRRRVREQWDLLALAFVVAAGVQTLSLIWTKSDLAATGFRDYLGYVGASITSVTLLGSDRFWVAPLALAFPAFFVASSTGTYPGALWSWPTLPVENMESWVVALLWAVLGTVAFHYRTHPRIVKLRVR
ncbi:hypothetical protein AB0933_26360 [Streptomyces venezuelae]|uniref:hypothetical protein n=1 Tax=Streptomyces venezuelae TaxID=54571 RepID=UPI0034558695